MLKQLMFIHRSILYPSSKISPIEGVLNVIKLIVSGLSLLLTILGKLVKVQCGEGKEAEKSGLQLKFRCEVTGQEWSNHIIC